MMKRPIAAIAMMLVLSSGQAMAEGIEGTWRTQEGRSFITIAPCGEDLCGTVSYLAEPLDETGRPKRDRNNNDPALRQRPLVGLTILTGLQRLETEKVWTGSVYNPEDGKTYSATISLHPRGIEVEGCLAYVLCGTQVWTPVKSP